MWSGRHGVCRRGRAGEERKTTRRRRPGVVSGMTAPTRENAFRHRKGALKKTCVSAPVMRKRVAFCPTSDRRTPQQRKQPEIKKDVGADKQTGAYVKTPRLSRSTHLTADTQSEPDSPGGTDNLSLTSHHPLRQPPGRQHRLQGPRRTETTTGGARSTGRTLTASTHPRAPLLPRMTKSRARTQISILSKDRNQKWRVPQPRWQPRYKSEAKSHPNTGNQTRF